MRRNLRVFVAKTRCSAGKLAGMIEGKLKITIQWAHARPALPIHALSDLETRGYFV